MREVQIGKRLITANASKTLVMEDVTYAVMERHRLGDWGEVCQEDAISNDLALQTGARLLSVYRDARGTKFWVITEETDQGWLTTVLLPEDY